MAESFYNTIKLRGRDLEVADGKAKSQEETILAFFLRCPGMRFTPFDIQEILLPGAPITSIRRAMTNLVYKDKLEKTKYKKPGKLGKPNYMWQLKRGQLTLF
jgi:hypothetical protein